MLTEQQIESLPLFAPTKIAEEWFLRTKERIFIMRFLMDITGHVPFWMAIQMLEEDEEMQEKLNRKIESLTLSVRSRKALCKHDILTLRDLLRKTKTDLEKLSQFGQTGLREVEDYLADIGLHLKQ